MRWRIRVWADTYFVLPGLGGGNQSENHLKSNAVARKALELDATLARPHAVLGSFAATVSESHLSLLDVTGCLI